MRTRFSSVFLLAVPVVCLLAGFSANWVYRLPPVHGRLAWRVEGLRTRIRFALNPPEEVVFTPQQVDQIDLIVGATLAALTPTPTGAPEPSPTPTRPGPTATPQPSPTRTLVPTPLPEMVSLAGVVHEYQQMNNCGPATLSMGLSFWGWQGDQRDTRAYLRPNFQNIDDKNIMPAEMQAYVEAHTDLKALWRVGGDLDTIRRLIAAGFPVIIEKGVQQHPKDWLGHFALVTGYDDGRARLITQDSLIMPDLPVPYEDLHWWRNFNYVFFVLYPGEREAEVLALLGPLADPQGAFAAAAHRAEEEIADLQGRDQFFAWYNLGSSRVGLQDYPGAAEAYDQAFALYPTIPEDDRPWRMLWYQTGPYEAYYYTGRYQDVINLADTTLSFLGAPILEESLYWRGLARQGQGDREGALADLQRAVDLNPNATPAQEALDQLEISD